MKFFFLLLFLLFPFGQVFRIPIPFLSQSILIFDLVLVIVVPLWFLLVGFKKIKDTPLIKPFSLFIIISFLSLVLNPLRLSLYELIFSGLYLVRLILYLGIFILAYNFLKEKKENYQFLSSGLIFSAVIFAFFGFWQYFFYPDIRNLLYLGWDPHYGRLVSTFFDPNFSGIILIFTFFLVLHINFTNKTNLPLLLLGIFWLALLLTFSRSSYLAFIVGLLVYGFWQKRQKLFLMLTFLFLISIFLLPKPVGEGGKLGRTVSSLARVENWQQSLKIFLDHPFWGVGFNTYKFAREKYGFLPTSEFDRHFESGADNSLLFILSTLGMVGFLGFVYLGKKITEKLTVFSKPLFWASVSALLIHSFFQNSLFYPWVMFWMFLIMALSTNSKEKSI